ncbi:MAG: single-stranded DNA-binding protein [Frankiaceae bacterium]
MTMTGAAAEHCNEVVLRGRLAAPAESRQLPSGDLIASFRLVVDRPARRRKRPGDRAPTVDTLDCVAWRAALRRAALAWRAGDTVEVTGALRRRFWRSPTGPVSRCEVEVDAASVVRAADR